jgi:hypothetical protein
MVRLMAAAPNRRPHTDLLQAVNAVNPTLETWCLALKTCYPFPSLIE